MSPVLSFRARIAGAAGAAGLLAVALAVPAQAAEEGQTEIQILGINDFHGRILPDAFGGSAGAASLATAVDTLEDVYPNTVFAAAGDLIGASTFESFIAHDKPTIDVLNAMGLDVSAVGNHEFDQGYADLVDRVMQPESDANPDGGAQWEYLGANVRLLNGDPALPETWIQTFGEVEVGFIGAVTDETPSLVSPDGVAMLEFEDEAVAANRSAAALEDEGADVIVLLVHEGAPTVEYADAVDTSNDFGAMLDALDPAIDAVVSGHTHMAYDHDVPVAEWAGNAVTERPVVSAGQYGMYLNQLIFTVDDATGEIVSIDSALIDLWESGADAPVYAEDPTVAEITALAAAEADVLGAVDLGDLDGPLYRARIEGGDSGSSRGAESTLGNAVAEAQRWATEGLGVQVAFMNPGGLRADMLGEALGTGEYPSAVTYKEAASVQPFANTLVAMTLTGEQLAAVLEEQWQPAGSSRPFLRLGTSDGFAYTYDPTADAGERILEITLDGEPIAGDDHVRIAVNSFLAAGGDNFATFAEGVDRADSGRIDLNAMVDYLADQGSIGPDLAQHSVGVAGLDTLVARRTATLELSSLAFTGAGELVDPAVQVSLGGVDLGEFAVDGALPTDLYDEQGTATVTFDVPRELAGTQELVITGAATGTQVSLTVDVRNGGPKAGKDKKDLPNGKTPPGRDKK
ncbi:bifunctional metallophosphatase/5'-nucleotidase [Demequina rhizosphaerae]|uniref:bifunctional metallophosphatase/5'-nucleotidase n=1 Tax=Demequina rhizosphaerae TaxID=1638985 RepID=UPI0009E1DD3D|nr:5'-nucleotidase C-terminal domain-containing protein [Demequina rhizosphaerae]